jgi:hypothetical protein
MAWLFRFDGTFFLPLRYPQRQDIKHLTAYLGGNITFRLVCMNSFNQNPFVLYGSISVDNCKITCKTVAWKLFCLV